MGSKGAIFRNPEGLPESCSNTSAPSSVGDQAFLESDSNTSAPSSAGDKALHSVPDDPASEDDVPYFKSSMAALQAYLAEYVPPDSLAIRVPSQAIAAVWKLLQVLPSPVYTASSCVGIAGRLSPKRTGHLIKAFPQSKRSTSCIGVAGSLEPSEIGREQ